MARQKKNQDQPENPMGDMTLEERSKMFKDLMNKKFKSNVFQTLAEDDDVTVKRMSSGILSLDLILGGGKNGYGWPVGRVVEIYAPESAGKTSVILSTIAEAQRNGKLVALIDAEHAIDLRYAQSFGVDIDTLMLSQPMTAEEGFNIAESCAESGQVDLIVIDSIAAMVPTVEADADMEDQFMGLAARLNNKFMRKIVPALGKNDCTLLLINQIREKMVMMGNPETTPGGRGIKFAASIRLEMRRVEGVEVNGKTIGHIAKFKTIKNKTAAPQKIAQARLDYGKGFNREFCLVENGTMLGVIEAAGAWTKYGEEKYNGRAKFVEALESNPELADKLESEIKEVLS